MEVYKDALLLLHNLALAITKSAYLISRSLTFSQYSLDTWQNLRLLETSGSHLNINSVNFSKHSSAIETLHDGSHLPGEDWR